MPNTTHTLDTELATKHYAHLSEEGFTPDHIWEMEQAGVKSLSQIQSLKQGFKVWDSENNTWVSSSGLKFPFTKTFAQIRCDNPPMRGSKPAKYLTPVKASAEAMLPKGCQVITEGAKDAWMGTLKGGIATGCLAGVSHASKALSPGNGLIILFDSDGWKNPNVANALIKAAHHCNGKIQLVPELEQFPKGGLCEYFKSGYKKEDYESLLSGAMWPDKFLWKWAERIENYPLRLRADCIKVIAKWAYLMGGAAA